MVVIIHKNEGAIVVIRHRCCARCKVSHCVTIVVRSLMTIWVFLFLIYGECYVIFLFCVFISTKTITIRGPVAWNTHIFVFPHITSNSNTVHNGATAIYLTKMIVHTWALHYRCETGSSSPVAAARRARAASGAALATAAASSDAQRLRALTHRRTSTLQKERTWFKNSITFCQSAISKYRA